MITVKLAGGLGNQMFQYAAGRALSLKHNTQLFLDLNFLNDRRPKKNFVYREFCLDIFDIDYQIASKDKILDFGKFERFANYLHPFYTFFSESKLAYVREDPYKFDEIFFEIKDNSYLEGFWQSQRYFEDIIGVIFKDFTFKDNLIQKNSSILEKINSGKSVCVNVRRGDFVNNPSSSSHHGHCNMNYFNNSIKLLCELYENLNFFVFSDDINWCYDNFKNRSNFYIVDHSFAGEKFSNYLFLMSKCNHFIIPNSSFGWWAAWLGSYIDKKVISPAKWYATDRIDTSHLLPKTWQTV